MIFSSYFELSAKLLHKPSIKLQQQALEITFVIPLHKLETPKKRIPESYIPLRIPKNIRQINIETFLEAPLPMQTSATSGIHDTTLKKSLLVCNAQLIQIQQFYINSQLYNIDVYAGQSSDG